MEEGSRAGCRHDHGVEACMISLVARATGHNQDRRVCDAVRSISFGDRVDAMMPVALTSEHPGWVPTRIAVHQGSEGPARASS